MRTPGFLTLVLALMIGSAGLSRAGAISQPMPTAYLDECSAKLMGAGYTGIRVVDPDARSLVAYDRDWSEVRIVMHAENRSIESVSYVRASDE